MKGTRGEGGIPAVEGQPVQHLDHYLVADNARELVDHHQQDGDAKGADGGHDLALRQRGDKRADGQDCDAIQEGADHGAKDQHPIGR